MIFYLHKYSGSVRKRKGRPPQLVLAEVTALKKPPPPPQKETKQYIYKSTANSKQKKGNHTRGINLAGPPL